jgi:cellulose synthase/poly-beta-1,6-N-acetylglucosamine synthase-like glycosyltransferase
MFSHLILDYTFVFSVVVIWFMLGYQFILFMMGYIYGFRAQRGRQQLESTDPELPAISIMIPAHNEGMVIAKTLDALQNLNYPRGKIEFLVINDGSSDDTASIVETIASRDSRVRLFKVPITLAARGKAAALNQGLWLCRHNIVGIFDADNRPEADSVIHLARQLVSDERLGAVVGKFRCINKKKNLLTRFINIEGIAFQWIIQAGRWNLFQMATLPGTNYLMRRSLIENLGGWDVEALTEDSELSIRIYEAGYLIKFIPYAVTWEQEPENLRVWFKQRVRWARGNNYVLEKHVARIFKIKPRVVGMELFHTMAVYYLFFMAILLSDLLFVLAVLGWISIPVPGPYREVWFFAFGLFTLELIIALSREREDTPFNIGLIVLSYFTYCQLWIAVVLKGFYDDFVLRREHKWDKTQRFEVDLQDCDHLVKG